MPTQPGYIGHSGLSMQSMRIEREHLVSKGRESHSSALKVYNGTAKTHALTLFPIRSISWLSNASSLYLREPFLAVLIGGLVEWRTCPGPADIRAHRQLRAESQKPSDRTQMLD